MDKQSRKKFSLSTIVTIFSVLFGISGLEHGLFEIFQGHSVPDGLIISAIGPAQRFWLHGKETAFTLIPDMAVTGCIAIIVSSAVILWSIFGIKTKHAWITLLILSIIQFLTGGGFAQIFLSIPLSVTACRINAPLSWWKKYISVRVRTIMGVPAKALCIALTVIFLISIEMAIFGFPFGKSRPELTYQILIISSYMMISIFTIAIISGLANESLDNIGNIR